MHENKRAQAHMMIKSSQQSRTQTLEGGKPSESKAKRDVVAAGTSTDYNEAVRMGNIMQETKDVGSEGEPSIMN